MNTPSLSDRVVKVTAYLTDEVFGYDHWRAAQFSSPKGKPAVLLIYDTEAERDAANVVQLAPLVSAPPPSAPTASPDNASLNALAEPVQRDRASRDELASTMESLAQYLRSKSRVLWAEDAEAAARALREPSSYPWVCAHGTEPAGDCAECFPPEPDEAEVARWRTFAEDAFVVVNEDGAVVLGAYLADDVESLAGATDTERGELRGDIGPTFGQVTGDEAVTRLWDAAVNAARQRAKENK
jgi:hypothetical protein